jgi:hypothetical protein
MCRLIDGPNKFYFPFVKGLKGRYWEEWDIISSVGLTHSLTYVTVLTLIFRVSEETRPPKPCMKNFSCGFLSSVMASYNTFMHNIEEGVSFMF